MILFKSSLLQNISKNADLNFFLSSPIKYFVTVYSDCLFGLKGLFARNNWKKPVFYGIIDINKGII